MSFVRLKMSPDCATNSLRYVGDTIEFKLETESALPTNSQWKAYLRTTIGCADAMRRSIIDAGSKTHQVPGNYWRDVPMVPMVPTEKGWKTKLALTEVGHFQSKAFLVDSEGKQHWPSGENHGLSVHPNHLRTANTIYCAFVRLFGTTKSAQVNTLPAETLDAVEFLDQRGYTVIPPSGTLRDLQRCLPHIFQTLGCRYLHLLPVNPTPTTFARFGRFGSPYACKDLIDIDPALVEFDQRTTAEDQFIELTDATHALGGRLILDIVINHTGWNSHLQEQHPEWFERDDQGRFASPGAWGNVWADLIELKPWSDGLWDELAKAFLVWCKRGVDGFRCDAGYKIPTPVWRYIIARVREVFPETVFLLEGLGGGWQDTANLLTIGGMQWAYSELFQEFSPIQVSGYLDHCLSQSPSVGTLVHYSETHDNLRLAAKGESWSRARNRLSALTSFNGAFGFTCGVEWFAREKINVHGCAGLSWGMSPNLVADLHQLNELLANHPCFFDTAILTRRSKSGAPIFSLLRESADYNRTVLVLANLDLDSQQVCLLAEILPKQLHSTSLKMVELTLPTSSGILSGSDDFQGPLLLGPGAVIALELQQGEGPIIPGSGSDYRNRRGLAALGLQALSHFVAPEKLGEFNWNEIAELFACDPETFLSTASKMSNSILDIGIEQTFRSLQNLSSYRNVLLWTTSDTRGARVLPTDHWLLVVHPDPFRMHWCSEGSEFYSESTHTSKGNITIVPPQTTTGRTILTIRTHESPATVFTGIIEVTSPAIMAPLGAVSLPNTKGRQTVLLTNGCGAMARIPADFATIRSKYDCFLGANLHPSIPVDRHVFVKRVRIWIMAGGFLTQLNSTNLRSVQSNGTWVFQVPCGNGRSVGVQVEISMVLGQNTTRLKLFRLESEASQVNTLLPVSATIRFDIEDRSFHSQTKRNSGAEHHFASYTKTLTDLPGFEFVPSPDRNLRVTASGGVYHVKPEWCENVLHIIEQERGQEGSGDAYSPGWFEIPLLPAQHVELEASVVRCHNISPTNKVPQSPSPKRSANHKESNALPTIIELAQRSLEAFIVARESGKTVIAGYPWFLDWGRDTFIAARGMIAGGYLGEVEAMLHLFGRFEDRGTLPNCIHGEDASNRDTCDAPLWFTLVCEELYRSLSTTQNATNLRESSLLNHAVETSPRSLIDVVRDIASGYIMGTPNGIKMDPASGLIWTPSHFTWMDTNYPACTPREGYPVEIQALWIRLLKWLHELGVPPVTQSWDELAKLALRSVTNFFWMEDVGYFADALIARSTAPLTPARSAPPDDSLRPNCLFLISLGLVTGERAKRTVMAAARHLVVPGAIRSLAPLPVNFQAPIKTPDGRLLNNPAEPYWGSYQGDEDTRRKPAYHNGTAWVWPFPTFCEALTKAFDQDPMAIHAARSYLVSCLPLFHEGCLGHLPEILDGDHPHTFRGCDAQAWSASEVLRVAKILNSSS